MQISVRTDVKRALADIDRVSRKSAPRALASAMSRAGKSARAVSIDAMWNALGKATKKGDVGKAIDLTSLRGAGRVVDGVRISIKKLGIPLGKFPCTQTDAGVSVRIPGRAAIFVPGAFLAKVGGRRGHKGVFLRSRNATHRGALRPVKRGRFRGKTYRPALPIHELFTSGGQITAIEQKVLPQQIARFKERFPIEFERALKALDRSVR